MRISFRLIRSRQLSRVGLVALLAGMAASCSDDTVRFSANPFSNPFGGSSMQRTASAERPVAYRPMRIRAEPLSPVATVPASRPIAAQPLPPIGSVSSLSDAAPPKRTVAYNDVTEPGVTGSVSGASPKVGGFKAGGWSATGGTVVAAQRGETVNTLSNRYGIPAEAIMKVNGLTAPGLSAGQQVIIPVYSATRPGAAVAPPQATTTADPSVEPVVVKTKRVSELSPFEDAPIWEHSRPMAYMSVVGEAQQKPLLSAEPAHNGSAKPKVVVVRQRSSAHIVRPGETLTAIALAYGTTRPRLAAFNGIDEWMSVKIGQQLQIPGAQQATQTVEVKAKPVAPRPVVERLVPPKAVPVETADEQPVKPRLAKPIAVASNLPKKVKPVQVADPVEQTASLQPKPLKPLKQVATTTTVKAVKPVTQLAAAPVVKAVKPAKPEMQVAATTTAKPLKPAKPVQVAINKPKTVPATKPVIVADAKPVKPAAAPQATASITSETVKPAAEQPAQPLEATKPGAPEFRWPVKGRIIQDFGQNSDGINISVPEGTEVKAAENGVVAYAGNELKGYGNLILIRHADGYVTAYAHTKDLNVKRGDTVRRGQTIATAGQTGNVTSPQLLFEVRKGATPLNPRQFLSGN